MRRRGVNQPRRRAASPALSVPVLRIHRNRLDLQIAEAHRRFGAAIARLLHQPVSPRLVSSATHSVLRAFGNHNLLRRAAARQRQMLRQCLTQRQLTSGSP